VHVITASAKIVRHARTMWEWQEPGLRRKCVCDVSPGF